MKRSAWRHSIRTITPRCQAHFYKRSLNDTQLAAWRQLSLPSLRPNPSLPLSFPPLSHSGVQLGCLPSLPPSHPSGARLRGAEAAKTHFLELVFTSFSFCGTSCAAWERLPDAQTAGEIILSFCFCQDFFLSLLLCLQRSSFPSVLFFRFFDMKQSESDPREMDHLLKRQTSEGQHHRKMSLTDIIQPNDIRQRHKVHFITAHLQCSTRLSHPLGLMFTSPSPLAASGGM